jgi:hypothetical protein
MQSFELKDKRRWLNSGDLALKLSVPSIERRMRALERGALHGYESLFRLVLMTSFGVRGFGGRPLGRATRDLKRKLCSAIFA